MSVFNDRFKELRDSSEQQSKDIAEELEITASRLSYYLAPGREPPYELLVKIANYFNVTTDYLVGRSNSKNYESEITAQSIQQKSGLDSLSVHRAKEVEAYSVIMYGLLRKLANAEIFRKSKSFSTTWEMIKTWLEGLDKFIEYLSVYDPPNYPLDDADAALASFRKHNRMANQIVGEMIENIVTDDGVDPSIKKRVRIIVRQSFSIRASSSDEDEE